MYFFSFLSLTVGASKLIEAQMDLPRLLFDVGFQIFIVTPQMYMGTSTTTTTTSTTTTTTAITSTTTTTTSYLRGV